MVPTALQAAARGKAVADAEDVLQAALQTEEQKKARRVAGTDRQLKVSPLWLPHVPAANHDLQDLQPPMMGFCQGQGSADLKPESGDDQPNTPLYAGQEEYQAAQENESEKAGSAGV